MMRGFIYCVVLFLLTVCSGGDKNELTPEDIVAIQALDAAYVSGWFDSNEKESVLSRFENEAIFIPHHGDSVVKGVDNLREFFWPETGTGVVHQFRHHPTEVQGTTDVAWVYGRFDVKYSWIDQDTTTTQNEGNYVLIARKQEDKEWKIATFIFNDPEAEVIDW